MVWFANPQIDPVSGINVLNFKSNLIIFIKKNKAKINAGSCKESAAFRIAYIFFLATDPK